MFTYVGVRVRVRQGPVVLGRCVTFVSVSRGSRRLSDARGSRGFAVNAACVRQVVGQSVRS